jgi:DNA-binding NarL/FixJ family response regulator
MTSRHGTTGIVIADDHPIFRDGLKKLLAEEPTFRVLGEAGDGDEAVQRVEVLKPDVLLLDQSMPRCTGLEALKLLSAAGTTTRTLLLTAGVTDAQIFEAVRLGARGVVLKGATTALLFKAIRAVMAGQYWIGHDTVSDLVRYLRERASRPGTPRPASKLTTRERQVVIAVADGCSNKDVASRLSLSEDTVKHHLTSIFDKLGVSTRLELAVYAAQHKLAERMSAEPHAASHAPIASGTSVPSVPPPGGHSPRTGRRIG